MSIRRCSRISKRLNARDVVLLAIVVALTTLVPRFADAQTFTTIYSFKGVDGAVPNPGLIVDDQGNLYGTTFLGGTSAACVGGCGTVFVIDAAGNETVLHSFNLTDGRAPESGLARDAQGNLYGTTDQGGAQWGLVYKLDANGNETVLHTFNNTPDGAYPGAAGLILDAAGNLYGATQYGGANGNGMLFKLTPAGKVVGLYAFPVRDGSSRSGIIRDGAGNLYGTTGNGGVHAFGEVYKVDTTGKKTILHSFLGGADGEYPAAGVVRDAAGNLYGTTEGHFTGNYGTVFRVSAAGRETVLHAFTNGSDGANPFAGVVRDAAGNLYGTTTDGGAFGYGTIFKIDNHRNFTVLYSFTGGTDGSFPVGLTLDSAGNLYGATFYDGAFQGGTVFKLVP
jgi:uncharacterized repeat protein (TIGR03803 family)